MNRAASRRLDSNAASHRGNSRGRSRTQCDKRAMVAGDTSGTDSLFGGEIHDALQHIVGHLGNVPNPAAVDEDGWGSRDADRLTQGNGLIYTCFRVGFGGA